MKIKITVFGKVQYKSNNKVYGDILGKILKRRVKVRPTTRSVGGKALLARIRYRNYKYSNTLRVGDTNTLIIEEGEYGRLYFRVDPKIRATSGSLSVNLEW